MPERLPFDRPRIMGILNVTPDSFFDGGRHAEASEAVRAAEKLLDHGADIIDIGGESTRPGAKSVDLATESQRVLPVVQALRERSDVPISIDTSKPELMRAAVAAGASMINDVAALRAPAALEVAADLAVPVCLMHMQGSPQTMQEQPSYADVVDEVVAFLEARIELATGTGVAEAHIITDPGFGFGKTLDHNLRLLANLDRIVALGFPVLVGLSRKSMFGSLLNRPAADRLPASLAAAAIALQQGATILRVHDVWPTADLVRLFEATTKQKL